MLITFSVYIYIEKYPKKSIPYLFHMQERCKFSKLSSKKRHFVSNYALILIPLVNWIISASILESLFLKYNAKKGGGVVKNKNKIE